LVCFGVDLSLLIDAPIYLLVTDHADRWRPRL
jgi:hypothetical protein